MGTTEKLSNFVAQTNYTHLPQDVVNKTKLILLDSIGCALGAFALSEIKIINEIVEEWGGNPQCSIIGGSRSSANVATIANAALINALDWDLIGPRIAHVTTYVTPSCIVVSDLIHASGKDLILALALGHEIGGRICNSVSSARIPKEEPPYYETGRYSYGPSVFGGTIGACRLLKMDSTKIAHALGMTGSSIPSPAMTKEIWTAFPAPMWKYNCWTGWLAPLATWAALFANKGFTSDPTIFDGEWGFWKIYGSAFFHENVIFDELGTKWYLLDAEFKPYPQCRCNHAGIDGINKIIMENNLLPQEIEEILVEGDSWLLAPFRSGKKITSQRDTQFLNSYIFANAVINGRNPSPEWQRPSTYDDQRIKELMDKVKVAVHPQAEDIIANKIRLGEFPLFWDTRVTITARKRKFVANIPFNDIRGCPGNPLSEEEVIKKFDINASYSPVDKRKIEKAKDFILGLEKMTDVSQLFSCLLK